MSANTRIETLKNYLEEDAADEFSRYLLALEYIKLTDDTTAKKHMEHLHLNHPEYLPNYYHFGKLLERNGETAKAIIIYKKGIEIAISKSDNHTKSELESALELCED